MSLRRGSILSVGSRMTYNEEDHFDDMTDDELRDTLERTIQTNRYLQLENEIFERYLLRHDPQSVQAMTQVLESAKHAQRVASQMLPITSALSLTSDRMGRGTSLSGSSTMTFTGSRRTITNQLMPKKFRISVSHRIEMTKNELEEMRKSLSDLEVLAGKTRANLRAQMEEIELRIRETSEAKAELEENVVRNGVDPITGRIPAEKFVRFMEEWLKAADAIIEKLRLKSASLKGQINKAKHQLAQKEELGETLHPIDFEQLAIENHKYQQKIERKNHHLLQMKKITGRCSLSLSNHKQKLSEQMTVLKSIEGEIARKKTQIENFANEEQATIIDSEKAAVQLRQITDLMDEYTVPGVIEFVKMQDELAEMQRTYKRLDRHCLIQQTAIRVQKNQTRPESDTKNSHEVNKQLSVEREL